MESSSTSHGLWSRLSACLATIETSVELGLHMGKKSVTASVCEWRSLTTSRLRLSISDHLDTCSCMEGGSIEISLFFVSHLLLEHLFQVVSGIWLEHFHLADVLTKGNKLVAVVKASLTSHGEACSSASSVLCLDGIAPAFKRSCVLFLFRLHICSALVVSVCSILLQRSLAHSVDVASLLKRKVFVKLSSLLVFPLNCVVVCVAIWSLGLVPFFRQLLV